MGWSLQVGRIGGISIRIHPSWLIVFFLISWSLALYYPSVDPAFSGGTAWLMGIISALLLFVSVLIHELSHAFAARARGMNVHSIVLFLFGGVSNLTTEPRSASGEFMISVVGPLTSLVLAGLCAIAAMLVGAANPAVTAVLEYLAIINLLLGLFNLIPGFPLDGGRVLRSIIWQFTGSLPRATRIATGVGQAVAYGFIILGIVEVLGGNLLGGVWLALIGWFLSSAAQSSAQQVALQETTAGVRVRDVMRALPITAPASSSVQRIVDEFMLGRNLRAVPVVDDETGRLVGMVTLSDLRDTPPVAWPQTSVRMVMSGAATLITVTPDDLLADALQKIAERDLDRLPVVYENRPVGILSRSDVIRYLQVRRLAHPHEPPASAAA
ncbi:MAG: site-2 protease family protein [Chloroflexi bacterium]|nr:site-2 protease family protein [Chloroflexota bacterium]